MEFYVKRKSSSSNETIKHSDDELWHFGILGMKWGVRRYQNYDGTLTEAGKKRNEKIDKKIEKITQDNNVKKEEYNNLMINGIYAGAPIELLSKIQGFAVERQAKVDKKVKALEDKKLKESKSFSKEEQKENASQYWKLSSSERVDSPIGKELLSGDSYKKFTSSLKKQEEIETRDLKDKSSDLYKAAHYVAEEYKKKAGDDFDRETYKYYDEIGGVDAQSRILSKYSKFSKEYAKAEKEWQDAVNNLYEESKALSNKYFGKYDALTRHDVIELAYDKMEKEDSQ